MVRWGDSSFSAQLADTEDEGGEREKGRRGEWGEWETERLRDREKDSGRKGLIRALSCPKPSAKISSQTLVSFQPLI
jgi:hypothetical protein